MALAGKPRLYIFFQQKKGGLLLPLEGQKGVETRVVPALDSLGLDELDDLALGQDRVGDVQPPILPLDGLVHLAFLICPPLEYVN